MLIAFLNAKKCFFLLIPIFKVWNFLFCCTNCLVCHTKCLVFWGLLCYTFRRYSDFVRKIFKEIFTMKRFLSVISFIIVTAVVLSVCTVSSFASEVLFQSNWTKSF